MEVIIRENHVQRGPQWIDVAKELMAIKQLIKTYEALEKKKSEELKRLSDGIDSKGGGFVYTCSMRAGSVDYKRIPELQFVDLSVYRNPDVAMWKLTMELE